MSLPSPPQRGVPPSGSRVGVLDFPLATRRLSLRPFTAEDAEAMARIYGDPLVMRYVDDGRARSSVGTAGMLAEYTEHQHRHGFSYWAVVDRATGELIGDAGLYRFGEEIGLEASLRNELEHEVELGYTLARSWWGMGLGHEVAARCLQAAAELRIDRLIALARPENVASRRILEHAGFGYERQVTAYGQPFGLYRYPR